MEGSSGDTPTKQRTSSSSGSIKMKRQSSHKSSTKNKKKEIKKDSVDVEDEKQIDMLTPKQNGYVEGDDGQSEEDKRKHTASIKGMWKKAFKSLKSNDKQAWLSKKGSLKKKGDEEAEEEPQEVSKEIDPVYSLLKCAADLPKVPKAQKDSQCPGHLTSSTGKPDNSSGSTSKASSPSSSGGAGLHLSLNHHHHQSKGSLDGSLSPSSPPGYQRETMHHIVDESLGSEFRTFYKLTSPVKKTWNGHSFKKQHSYPSTTSNHSFDHN